MEEVLHYLQLKNQFYEKFYSVTCKFLDQANRNQWDDIENFVDNRERILNIIHSFDFKIASLFQKLNLSKDELDKYRGTVKEILDARAALANQIVRADLELITKMDEMKNDTIKDLKKSVETMHQINSFTTPTTSRVSKPRKEV